MKAFLLAAALALSACNGTPIPTSPGQVANQTVLDEKVAITTELAYTTAARAAALAIRIGIVSDPAQIRRVGDLDNQAKAAVGAVRQAYDAGNAASYAAAFTQADSAIRALLAIITR